MNNLQYRMKNENIKLVGVHPETKIGERVVFGKHCIIEEGVTIGDDCFIGHFTHIRPNSVLKDRVVLRSFCLVDPGCTIGNDCSILPHATVGGGAIFEDKVYFGPYSLTTNVSQFGFHRKKEAIVEPVTIKYGAIIAAGCMIKPGVVIGKNSILGLGSVLTKDVPDNEMWFGNPAKKHRGVPEDERVIYGEAQIAKGITDYHEDLAREIPIWPYSIEDME